MKPLLTLIVLLVWTSMPTSLQASTSTAIVEPIACECGDDCDCENSNAESADTDLARCPCKDKPKDEKKHLVITKACSEGGCPIQMIERLREEKQKEREAAKLKIQSPAATTDSAEMTVVPAEEAKKS